MEALRKLSFQEKMAGQVGSMSAMVRAAIDSLPRGAPPRALTEALTRSPERSNARSSERCLARTSERRIERDMTLAGCGNKHATRLISFF